MKILIVDDESHVVDAVTLLVPWEELGISKVLIAFSVQQANELLDMERPEIAIVDVVIGDALGTEILAHINERKLPTKVIVISGYDDYEYIRNMFVLGGIDYLLKPIEQEPLILAVRKAISQAETSAGDREKKEERTALSDYQRSLYRSLLLAASHDVIYAQICRDNPKAREASSCQVLYADCFFLPVWSEDYLLKLNKLLDRLRQRLERADRGTLFHMSAALTDIVILLYGDFSSSLEWIIKNVRGFNYENKPSLCFGCSELLSFPEGAAAALAQARNAANFAGKEENCEMIPYDPSMSKSKKHVEMKWENRLFSSLIAGEEKEIEAALLQWFSHEYSEGMETAGGVLKSRGEMRTAWEHFQFLFEKWNRYFADKYADYGIVSPPRMRQLEASIRKGEKFEQAMLSVFQDGLKRICAEKKRQLNPKSRMREIADYLELNYESRFQQAECARLFHLNKDYMSRKFKEELGIGMVEYVNRIRIEKAKELLCSTDKSIQEISDSTGFMDQKFFSKQFKRETSLSPTEYRQKKDFIQKEMRKTGR